MQDVDNGLNNHSIAPQTIRSMPSTLFTASRPARPPLTACALAAAVLLGSWCVGALAQTPESALAVAPLAVPANWSADTATVTGTTPASRSTADLAPWWTRFNDPLLSRLITQSLQANTSIRSAQAALLQARALRDAKAGDMRPGVSASASAQTSQTDSSPSTDAFRAGLDASWELDLFGAKRNALSATEADAAASEASLADVQVSVAAELALAYLALRGQQARPGGRDDAVAGNDEGPGEACCLRGRWRARSKGSAHPGVG